MAATPYSIERVDLSVVTTTPRELVKPGRAISSVAVLALASGAEFKLHIGQGPGIPAVAQGFQMRSRPRRDPQGNCTYPALGLFASVETAFSATAIIMVTYGDEGLLELSGGGVVSTAAPDIAEGYAVQNGSLGDAPSIWIANPTLSSVPVRVRSIRCRTAGTSFVVGFPVSYIPTAGTGGTLTTFTKRWEDNRKAGAPVAVLQGTDFADATTRALPISARSADLRGTDQATVAVSLLDLMTPHSRWILRAGTSLLIRGDVAGAGVQIVASVEWDDGGA